jgi:hypothetical protein
MKIFRDGLELEALELPKVVIRGGNTCEVFKTNEGTTWFLTLGDTPFCAHGDSFHEALAAAKEKQNPGAGKAEAIARVRKTQRITLPDFCLITGACRAGATTWAKQMDVSLKARLPVKKTLAMLAKSASANWGARLKIELEGSGDGND